MTSIVNIGSSCSSENLNETKQDPFKVFPNELVLEIFSRLNLARLGSICSVSKAWKQLVNRPILWKNVIYREIAFGNDKWAQCFGPDVIKNEDNKEEFSSLPYDEFIADCKKFKSIFPGRNAKDILMLVRLPKTLNGGITLKSLGELAMKFFSASKLGYKCIMPSIIQKLGDKSIDKSQWVLMTKDVLPGSRKKSYVEHQKMVSDLAENYLNNYEVAEVLESTACILSLYFGSNIRLFSDSPCTYTHCQENVEDFQIIVGGFAPTGLNIEHDYCNPGHELLGVAAMRKFVAKKLL